MNEKNNYFYNRIRSQEALAVFDTQFAVVFGLEQAIFLSRLIFFCRPESKVGTEIDGYRWYYSTYVNWVERNFPWMNERSLRRMVNELEERKLIISFQERSLNRQKYYRPNFELIWELFNEKFPEYDDNPDSPSAENGRPCGQNGHMTSGQSGHMLINSKSLTVKKDSISSIEDMSSPQKDADDDLDKLEENKPKVAYPKVKVVKPPVRPARKPRSKKKADPEETALAKELFYPIADVCNMDRTLMASRIAKAAHALAKAGYTPQQVLAFTSYWQKTSFQYRQYKKPPTPEQLIAQIKQSIDSLVSTPDDPNYYEQDQLTLAEREERRKQNDRA